MGFLESDLKLSHSKEMVWRPCQNDSVIPRLSEMKSGIILEAETKETTKSVQGELMLAGQIFSCVQPQQCHPQHKDCCEFVVVL